MNLSTYDHYGYAVVALLGTFGAVWAVLLALARPAWQPRLRQYQGVVPPFINIVGVLFGLTLAFIANDSWNAHDKATSAVYREAGELRSLGVLSGTLPETVQSELRLALVRYAESAADEWLHLSRRESSGQTDAVSAALLLRVASREVAAAAGEGLRGQMLRSVAELRQSRELRISLSQTHLNPLKWLGMAFLGLMCILSVAVVHVDHPRAAAASLLLFALSAAPTAAIVLVQGNPFQQPSFVSAQPLLDAVRPILAAR